LNPTNHTPDLSKSTVLTLSLMAGALIIGLVVHQRFARPDWLSVRA